VASPSSFSVATSQVRNLSPGALFVETRRPGIARHLATLLNRFHRPFVLMQRCDMIRTVSVEHHPSQRDSMNSDFKPGDVVRHKSGGKDITIIRFEVESVDGVTKKVAYCGRSRAKIFTRKRFQ
jgi:uncharacterized protein YodC (DUF2158 family)